MSATYFRFYKNLVQNKAYTQEEITDKVSDAYNKGRLTSKEQNDLLALIESVYAEE